MVVRFRHGPVEGDTKVRTTTLNRDLCTHTKLFSNGHCPLCKLLSPEENWGVSPPPWKGPTLHWQRTSFAQIVQSHSTHSRHQLPELIFCQLRISKVRLVIVNHQLSWSSHTHTPLGGYSSSSSSEKRKRSFSLREGFPKKNSCSFWIFVLCLYLRIILDNESFLMSLKSTVLA